MSLPDQAQAPVAGRFFDSSQADPGRVVGVVAKQAVPRGLGLVLIPILSIQGTAPKGGRFGH